jgi:hypothetical protein
MTEPTISKAIWIEPEVLSLDVEQTSVLPNRGADGGIFVDCTRS